MSALKETAQQVMEVALKAGANDAVAEAVETDIKQVRYSNSQIDAINAWTERNVILFVAVGKRIMSSDLRELDKLGPLTEQVVSLAKKAPPSKTYGGIASGKFKYARPKFDRRILSLDDPSKPVLEAIAGAEAEGAVNVGGTLFVRHTSTGIASSGGALAFDENASLDLSVRAFSQLEASGHTLSCTSRLSALRPRETGQRAGQLASRAKDPIQGDQGKFDLVIEPMCLTELINTTSNMMSAMLVEIGSSMYAKKIGKQVASRHVTFVDDPTMESMSRQNFDHEGVPTRRNVLIKDGILKTYLHSTSTAKRFKTKTTANAGFPIPTPFTMPNQPMAFHPVVIPGTWKVEDMISDVKKGLYINNAWYTRYQNYSTGEFSTIPRDAILRIENGEIVGAVKNVRVSDNMLNLWKNIDALSKNTEEIYWWDEAAPPSTVPTVRIRQMNITRSS
jgi:PmbA protein